MTGPYSDEEIGGLGSGPRYPVPEWLCICGSGDDGEWHTAACAIHNTPDDIWNETTTSKESAQ